MAGPPFQALVVDDEAPARGELGYLLRQSARIRGVSEAESASQAMDLLLREGADVLFVDIQMPAMDGLQLAQLVASVPEPPRVVFVTAFEQHAVEAFQLAAFDYLLKPIRTARLNLTLERLAMASRQAVGEAASTSGSSADRLAATSHGRIVLVPLDEVLVAEVAGDRVVVVTAGGRYTARLRIQELEERLSQRGFMRVHRHYLVNLRHVSGVESFVNSTYLLRLRGATDLAVPVSRRHGPALRAALGL